MLSCRRFRFPFSNRDHRNGTPKHVAERTSPSRDCGRFLRSSPASYEYVRRVPPGTSLEQTTMNLQQNVQRYLTIPVYHINVPGHGKPTLHSTSSAVASPTSAPHRRTVSVGVRPPPGPRCMRRPRTRRPRCPQLRRHRRQNGGWSAGPAGRPITGMACDQVRSTPRSRVAKCVPRTGPCEISRFKDSCQL